MLSTRKALYYLDKGKTKEAIQLLEQVWNQELNQTNINDVFPATVILSDVLYQNGERFSEIYQHLTNSLEVIKAKNLSIDAFNYEQEKAKQILKELDDFFSEIGQFFKEDSLKGLWQKISYNEYLDLYPTAQRVAELEQELGYKLPKSYIYLMRHTQNGGLVSREYIATKESTSWAEDCAAITGIMGIGSRASSSLNGHFNTDFWISEWGYPPIGLAIADCPSAGHDMIFLDYRKCGKRGEPEVVHVDQESDYKITWLAKNFESFVDSLYVEEY
ncbi:SMI1/KNR4 family protein [Listeria ivanovii]|uniref:SMI1/KNR4 family protein n=1 Tax=Listeria ivanovii TaxID=1638 RepID=UPI0030D4842D